MLEVTECFYTATWFRMRHWATHKLRCCDPFPSTAFLQRTNTEERWTTGAFQICSGKEFTNHNSNQTLWLWLTKWVRECFSWVVVEQALLWHLGLNHIEQKRVCGVTSNEDGTLPLQSWIPLASHLERNFGTKQLFQKVSFQTLWKSPTSPHDHHHHHNPGLSFPSVLLNLKV